MSCALLLVTPVALALAMAPPAPAAAHEGHKPRAGVREPYAFPIATPGTYRLPPIKRAAGGSVLDETGRRHDLVDLVRGRTTVLSFIYTRCGDVCPTATLDLSQLQDLAGQDRRLRGRMRLITMSLDVEHDTPEVMREFAAQWRSGDRASPSGCSSPPPTGMRSRRCSSPTTSALTASQTRLLPVDPSTTSSAPS